MNLGRKLTYAKQAIESILRHDDAPLADRTQAAAILREHLDAEEKEAADRNKARAEKSLKDVTPE